MFFETRADALAYYKTEVLPAVHAAKDSGNGNGEFKYQSFAGFAEDCEFGSYELP